MKSYTLSLKGEFHVNHNEDYLVLERIGKEKLLISVLDGCSSGIESHFASTLIGKILKKLAKELDYKEFIVKEDRSNSQLLRDVMKSLFEQLNSIKNQLNLNRYELLSTIVIGIVDVETRTAELLTIGDGLVLNNGEQTEYDQDNQPDYIGYHLEESFNQWYDKQEQKLSLTELNDLSISTDGIFSFKEFRQKEPESKSEAELIEYLLLDKSYSETEVMLKKKVLEIESNWNLKPSDDISMIRIIW